MTAHSERLPDVHRLMALPGPFSCTKCGSPVGHPMGLCDSCCAAYAERNPEEPQVSGFDRLMARARKSIPESFREARFSAPWLRPLIGPAVFDEVLHMSPLPRMLTLVGANESGKTSLACAMLQRIHDWANPSRPHVGIERARRAYFVTAGDLLFVDTGRFRDKADPEVMRAQWAHKLAQRAHVLVIDNVEAGRHDDAVGRIVMERFNRSATTILTTWMSKAEAGKHYGGGWARRAYEKTITLGDGA